MTVKFTMLFQLTTNTSDPLNPARRIGGWSESWYDAGTDINATLNKVLNGTPNNISILTARAGLLPLGASIIGQRFQVVDPAGASQTTSHQRPGGSGLLADVPQQALLVRMPGVGVANIRRTILRGIPDARIVDGEYAPSGAYAAILNIFFDVLSEWRFRGRDLGQPTFDIFDVTAAGVVTTTAPPGYAINDRVRILRTMTTGGDQVGGVVRVSATGPTANNFTVVPWPHGATTGGRVRREAVVYPLVSRAGISISRTVTRRVGRPFTAYRGRRSKVR